MSGMTIRRLGVGALVLAAACMTRAQAARIARPQRDVISRQELLDSGHGEVDLYQAIGSLRPQFFSAAPGVGRASSAVPIAVYVEGIRQPGAIALRSIRASTVEEVRYLNPTAALNEFGPIAGGGALVVTMYRPDPDTLAVSALRRTETPGVAGP
jgi:hypothetical protein